MPTFAERVAKLTSDVQEITKVARRHKSKVVSGVEYDTGRSGSDVYAELWIGGSRVPRTDFFWKAKTKQQDAIRIWDQELKKLGFPLDNPKKLNATQAKALMDTLARVQKQNSK